MTSTPHPGRQFATIGVVGLGTMGAGIAEVFARNGFSVVGVEVTDEPVERDYGTDFGIRDPFGNHVRISQPNGAPTDQVQADYDAAAAR